LSEQSLIIVFPFFFALTCDHQAVVLVTLDMYSYIISQMLICVFTAERERLSYRDISSLTWQMLRLITWGRQRTCCLSLPRPSSYSETKLQSSRTCMCVYLSA